MSEERELILQIENHYNLLSLYIKNSKEGKEPSLNSDEARILTRRIIELQEKLSNL